MLCVAVNSDLVFLNEDAKAKCPKFACGSDKENCAVAKGKMTESRTITFSSCDADKTCKVDGSKFYTDDDVSGKCEAKTTPTPPKGYLYPGEACENKDQCKQLVWYDDTDTKKEANDCKTNKCEGSAKGKKCQDDSSCVVGHYCKASATAGEPGVCTVLAKATEGCETSYQCDNNSVCNAKKCVAAFSLEKGAKVELPDTESFYGDYACATGLAKNSKCAEYKYNTDAKNVANGVVTCDYKAKCNYFYVFDDKAENNVKEEKECVCAYSDAGVGYCPFSYHDATIGDRYKQVLDMKKANLGDASALHTLNKFSNSIKGKEASSAGCQGVYLGVSSYKPLDCLKNAVCTTISAGFVKYSIFALLGLLFFLF
jgi:hypothetical protein